MKRLLFSLIVFCSVTTTQVVSARDYDQCVKDNSCAWWNVVCHTGCRGFPNDYGSNPDYEREQQTQKEIKRQAEELERARKKARPTI